jgi:O-antigen/teichoic acid export membrane protein
MVNTLHAASGRIAALALWLLFTPPILHALGPDGFAVWALFYALTGYLYSMDFGLAQGTLRSAAAARERGDHAEAGVFGRIAVIGYLALGAVWVIAMLALRAPILSWLRIPPGLAPDAGFAMVVGAGVFVAGGVANVTMSLLQGYGRFDLANSVLLTMTGAQAVGLLIALRHPTPLRSLVMVVGAASLLGCVTGFTLVRTAIPELRWGSGRETRQRVREVMRFGGPMQVTNLLATIHVHLDKLLISRFVALASVASYELGSRVASMVSTFPQLLLLPVVPESAAMEAAGQSIRLRELYRRGSRFYLAVAALGMAGAVACAGRVYTVWLGSPQPEATLVLRGLATAIGISLLTGMGTTIARGVGRTDLEMWFAVCAVALHLLLSLLWVPRHGLPGALAAILLGNLVGSVLFLVLFARLMHWPIGAVVVAPIVRPIAAFIAGALAGWSIDRALPPAHGVVGWLALTAVGTTSVIATSLVLWVTGGLSWNEVRVLFRRES